GLLGSYSFFQKEFVTAIEKKKDEHTAKRLQAIIKPFVLRRTKNQVATELPPKTEQIIYCEMDEAQAEIYESTKSEYRNALLEGAVNNSAKGTQIALLQGLTKLRQLANHPKMVDTKYSKDSGKFKAVIEMLQSISSEGNKVLIFSQFVKHLDLFKEYFDKKDIPYAYLDGATKDRARAVQEFKEKEEVRIFLISIKAGGVGLNLTEADYVFILDPWWNPAVEQQAIDRSHRPKTQCLYLQIHQQGHRRGKDCGASKSKIVDCYILNHDRRNFCKILVSRRFKRVTTVGNKKAVRKLTAFFTALYEKLN